MNSAAFAFRLVHGSESSGKLFDIPLENIRAEPLFFFFRIRFEIEINYFDSTNKISVYSDLMKLPAASTTHRNSTSRRDNLQTTTRAEKKRLTDSSRCPLGQVAQLGAAPPPVGAQHRLLGRQAPVGKAAADLAQRVTHHSVRLHPRHLQHGHQRHLRKSARSPVLPTTPKKTEHSLACLIEIMYNSLEGRVPCISVASERKGTDADIGGRSGPVLLAML